MAIVHSVTDNTVLNLNREVVCEVEIEMLSIWGCSSWELRFKRLFRGGGRRFLRHSVVHQNPNYGRWYFWMMSPD